MFVKLFRKTPVLWIRVQGASIFVVVCGVILVLGIAPRVLTANDKQLLIEELIQATRQADSAQVRRLLQAGADVKAKSRDGSIALTEAVDKSNFELVNLLLDHGANIDEDEALSLSAYKGNVEMVKLLLGRGADPNIGTRNGSPILIQVAQGYYLVLRS